MADSFTDVPLGGEAVPVQGLWGVFIPAASQGAYCRQRTFMESKDYIFASYQASDHCTYND